MKNLTKELKILNDRFEELCTCCNGLGHIADKECPSCDATGFKQANQDNNTEECYENIYSRSSYDRNNQDFEVCSECGGMGHIHDRECYACDATGLVVKNRKNVTKTQNVRPGKPNNDKTYGKDFTICSVCDGQGHIDEQECFNCGSMGLIQKTAMVYDLGHYAELYRKHISCEKRQAWAGNKADIVMLGEKSSL